MGRPPLLAAEFRRLFDGLAAIGRDPRGGWTRLAWTAEDRAARRWFTDEAGRLGLDVETDSNANLWAWWGDRHGAGAVATGSHLDTVPGGGAYDGALGVVAGLLAVRLLRARGLVSRGPLAVVACAEEEGGRSGLATFGSRLAAGTLDPARAVAALPAGVDLAPGPEPQRLARLACFVELHVEQGRGLVDLAAPLGVGSDIWPHGRWRLRLTGAGNHAGTTRLVDRRDPMLPLAAAIDAARRAAGALDAVATVGRIEVEPGATNAVAASVTAWLDARAPDPATLERLVGWWARDVADVAAAHRVECAIVEESRSGPVSFDPVLTGRVTDVLRRRGLPAPRLATAAGHDAGALATAVPTAMLFVRNPTGISHHPAEAADEADCLLGVEVLAEVLAGLLTEPTERTEPVG